MSPEGERILIVDDEEPIRRLLHQKLSGEGYRCEEAGSADEALDKQRTQFDPEVADAFHRIKMR